MSAALPSVFESIFGTPEADSLRADIQHLGELAQKNAAAAISWRTRADLLERALRRLVNAERTFERDTGHTIPLNDLVSDAVKRAERVLGPRRRKVKAARS